MKIDPIEIFGETYRTAARWWQAFLLVAAVVSLLSNGLNAFLVESLATSPEAGNSAGSFWSTWVLLMLVMVFLQAVQLSTFDAVMSGREDWFAVGFSRALRRLFPVVIGVLIYFGAYLVGLIFLVVPGVMALFLLMMMMPLILLDETGPIDAVGKSWKMTWGNAWRLFASALIAMLPVVVVMMPFAAALGVFVSPDDGAVVALNAGDWQFWVWTLVTAAASVVSTSFYLVVFRSLKAVGGENGNTEAQVVSA